jgi:hypothetical protein
MKILCILQNTWAHDPARVNALLQRPGIKRHCVVERLLFAGCLTGKRIGQVFSDMFPRHHFIFENASTVVTGDSGGRPPYNVEHVRSAILLHRPDVILAFGTSSKEAIKDLRAAKRVNVKLDLPPVVECLHPAVQKPGWLKAMLAAKEELEKVLEKCEPEPVMSL